MRDKKDTLYLFTVDFPYGKSEITYLEPEIKFLSINFSNVFIFPFYKKGEISTSLPDNVKVIYLFDNYIYNSKKTFFNNFLLFTSIIITEFIFCKKKKNFLKYFAEIRSHLLQLISRSNFLLKYLKEKEIDTNNIIFYSYWFDEWATILAILSKKGNIDGFITRTHGFDTYDERSKYGFISFRRLQLKQVSKVYAISKFSQNYLIKKFPQYRHKISFSYPGVSNDESINIFDGNKFTIVSCSSLIPLKRVHIIAQALKLLKFNLKWIHFGDGEERKKIEEILFDANFEYNLRGQTENKEILSFYRNTSVSLFIHTSQSEGMPWAIQEAISFGIPVMACDAGGVAEIVTDKTGVLLPQNITPVFLAEKINEFKNSHKNTLEFRKEVKQFWKENFNADKNYNEFCKEIKSVN